MSVFDDREKSYERKFEHDQELAFKVKARRHKLLGLWAAGQLGLSGDAAESYAAELVALDLARHGDEAAVDKIVGDFTAKGVAIDAARVRVELAHCEREAKKQLGAP